MKRPGNQCPRGHVLIEPSGEKYDPGIARSEDVSHPAIPGCPVFCFDCTEVYWDAGDGNGLLRPTPLQLVVAFAVVAAEEVRGRISLHTMRACKASLVESARSHLSEIYFRYQASEGKP